MWLEFVTLKSFVILAKEKSFQLVGLVDAEMSFAHVPIVERPYAMVGKGEYIALCTPGVHVTWSMHHVQVHGHFRDSSSVTLNVFRFCTCGSSIPCRRFTLHSSGD